MTVTDELLPCPFCGSRGWVTDARNNGFWAYCSNDDCGAEVAGQSTPTEAAALWNRRSAPAVPAQGAEPVAWITADAIESLQADGMCALAAGRKQSAVYSAPIYTNPVPAQGAVKALEWRPYPGDGTVTFEGYGQRRQYMEVARHAFGSYALMFKDGVYSVEDMPGEFGSAKEAMSAVQAHHKQRILSALHSPAHSGEREAWPVAAKFKMGDRVRKRSGSWWEGVIVGFYSTEQTPIGYNVQHDTVPNGPVQIFPEAALEAKQP